MMFQCGLAGTKDDYSLAERVEDTEEEDMTRGKKKKKPKGPGFEIKNNTQWPVQVSLEQVGPLFWGVVQPGKTFKRDTGAVWFTIKATIVPDGKPSIKTWDAVWPIALTTVVVIATVFTAGMAAGPALVATGGMTGAAAAMNTAIASAMVGAGFTANTALSVAAASGAILSYAAGAATDAVKDAVSAIFSGSNVTKSRSGCYAGLPWPGNGARKKYSISGGPTFTNGPDGTALLGGQKLKIS